MWTAGRYKKNKKINPHALINLVANRIAGQESTIPADFYVRLPEEKNIFQASCYEKKNEAHFRKTL